MQTIYLIKNFYPEYILLKTQQEKYPINKMGQKFEHILHQKWHVDGKAHEKAFSMTSHWGKPKWNITTTTHILECLKWKCLITLNVGKYVRSVEL